jgi:hypothetical protein
MSQDVILGFPTPVNPARVGNNVEQVNEGHGFSRAVDTPKVEGL